MLAFVAHGHCFLWNPWLTTLHVLSDAVIGLSYYSIPAMLLYFGLKSSSQQIPHLSKIGWFAAFILLCGTSHFLAIWTVWHPNYWIEGVIKAATAWISLYTAISLPPLIRPILKSIAAHRELIVKWQRAQAHLDGLLACPYIVAWVKDQNLRIVYSNGAMIQLFGDRIGLTDREWLPAEAATATELNDKWVLETQQSLEATELVPLPTTGEIHQWQSYKFPVSGNLVGGIAFDLTPILFLQQQLTQVNQDLDGANEELTRFIYAACHDLSAPLRTIINYLQRLERRLEVPLKQDQKSVEYLNRAVSASSRLQELIATLSTFSKASREDEPLKAVSLLFVVESAIENLGIAIRDTGAIVQHPERLPSLIGNQSQLIQLFQNLIGNGIKYQPPSQTPLIHIDVNEITGAWHITVKDNGIGIDRQHYDQIFEMFRRLHSADEYVGTGMGLAIVKRIVEKHRGRIWVESKPGQGSAFHFTIPA